MQQTGDNMGIGTDGLMGGGMADGGTTATDGMSTTTDIIATTGTSVPTDTRASNSYTVYEIDPWTLGEDYSSYYPNGLVVPVNAIIAWSWGNATHGVYKIPTEECPTTFQNGLNGMEAIQEPVNGLGPGGAKITVSYTVKKPGVYYFACPVGSGSHCRRGMKVKVTAK
jgi:plastocyanin